MLKTNGKTQRVGCLSDEHAAIEQNPNEYIQKLGIFLGDFTHIEVRISEIIRLLVATHGLPELAEALSIEPLSKQIKTLEKLAHRNDRVRVLPLEKIKALSEFRNSLAHGSFRINYVAGTYKTVTAKKEHQITPDDIDARHSDLNDLFTLVDQVWMQLYIDQLDDPSVLFTDPVESDDGEE